MDQVTELESAILQRAERLAEEYRKQAVRSRDTILRETAEKLHLREQREVLLAKSKGERAYRRKVQANELKLHAEMDHLRWNLVEGVRSELDERIRAFVADDDAYLELLKALIREGAREVEKEHLMVGLNGRDHERLAASWGEFSAGIADDKTLELDPEPVESVGGAVVRDPPNRIRLDNTFEGRLERLESRLHQVIIERLLPGDSGITAG